MSSAMEAAIDHDAYPHDPTCMYCGGTEGHSEVLHTGDNESPKSGFDVWFCCHPCRDAGKPCETFHAIRLLPSYFVGLRGKSPVQS